MVYRAMRRPCSDEIDLFAVIAGLDPAIPINVARRCIDKRDGRVKPGHVLGKSLTPP
jgi:hypothetical protein